jgi:hypothetical protein
MRIKGIAIHTLYSQLLRGRVVIFMHRHVQEIVFSGARGKSLEALQLFVAGKGDQIVGY